METTDSLHKGLVNRYRPEEDSTPWHLKLKFISSFEIVVHQDEDLSRDNSLIEPLQDPLQSSSLLPHKL